MGIVQRAIDDFKRFSGDLTGFGVSATMTAPNSQTCTVVLFNTKHHLGINDLGQQVKTKIASTAVSELNITEANPNYPVRNSDNQVDLKDHFIDVADSTGVVTRYSVMSWLPDEYLGGIVIMLEDYVAD